MLGKKSLMGITQGCFVLFWTNGGSISEIIQVKQGKHAGHCWRSRKKLISDVLPLIPINGRDSVGRPARTCIHQLHADTGCSQDDLPRAVDDRDRWRVRQRDFMMMNCFNTIDLPFQKSLLKFVNLAYIYTNSVFFFLILFPAIWRGTILPIFDGLILPASGT